MAIIIRNGIEYAGGGSGGIEITQADYNALGDKVKTDGVTYFIIDPDEEQSFAENCKIRYNEENDTVETFVGGEWVKWKIGGYTKPYVVREGVYDPNYPFKIYSETGVGEYTIDQKENFVRLTIKNGNHCYVVVDREFDFSKYSALKFSIKSFTNGYTNYDNPFVSVVGNIDDYTSINTSRLAYTTINGAGDYNLDVSAINSPAYIMIKAQSHGGGYPTTIEFTDLHLELFE